MLHSATAATKCLVVCGHDINCVVNARKSRLGPNSLDGILVEETIEPWNLGDLRDVSKWFKCHDRIDKITGAK